MATIKSYTDINQSRKLEEILPLESADMHYNDWVYDFYDGYEHTGRYLADLGTPKTICGELDIPCWSIAALLNILPNGTNIVKEEADTENEHYMCTVGIKNDIITTFGKNPVDACVTMIEKINERKML